MHARPCMPPGRTLKTLLRLAFRTAAVSIATRHVQSPRLISWPMRNRADNSLFISRNRLVIQVGLGQSQCPDRTPDRRDVGSDQAGARVISEVGPEPFERYDHSIAHPGQEQDVDRAPDLPGDSAGKA